MLSGRGGGCGAAQDVGSRRRRGAQQRLLCLTRCCAFREPRRRWGSAGRGLEVAVMARDRRLGLRVAGNGAGGPPYNARACSKCPEMALLGAPEPATALI